LTLKKKRNNFNYEKKQNGMYFRVETEYNKRYYYFSECKIFENYKATEKIKAPK